MDIEKRVYDILNELGIKVQEDQEQGRYCVAAREFSIGDVILRCDPLVESLFARSRYCCSCYKDLSKCDKPVPCPGCSASVYCCEECRQQDWEQKHSKECELLSLFSTSLEQCTAALFVRLMELKDREWEFLRPSPEYTGNEIQAYKKVIDTIVHKKGIADCGVPEKIFSCVYNNGFSIEDDNGKAIGVGVFLQASLFSHSCVYNATRAFKGKSMCIRACRRIEPGEEITITYTNLLDSPVDVRREKLRSHYGFVCKCPRCVAEEKAQRDKDYTSSLCDMKREWDYYVQNKEKINALKDKLYYEKLYIKLCECK